MKPMTQSIELADERAASYWGNHIMLEDRKRFVKNLGILLSQTKERIISISLSDHDIVNIIYNDGSTKYVDVRGDDYVGIISDILINL